MNSYTWNFKGPLDRIASICDSWSHRMLSLKGKITVANVLLISLLQYPASVTYTSERVAREYKKTISNLIWESRRPKIPYASLIQFIDRGGLKLKDLEIRIKVNLLPWFKPILLSSEMNTARALANVVKTEFWFE